MEDAAPSTSKTDRSDTGPSDAPTRRSLLREGQRRLEAAGREVPRRTAEWLLAEVLDTDRAGLYTHPRRQVAAEAAGRYTEMVQRRAEGEPLQHVLGYASFRGLRIEVSPDVMIPRPETEEVVEVALQAVEDTETPRVLDAGTGSGCIALALKHERPGAEVHACDVSHDALAVARANAQRLGLNVSCLHADILRTDLLDRLPGGLDLLVSNPPYIPDDEADTLPPVVREHDPDEALFAGDDPLRFYRALVDAAHALCTAGAAAVLETHASYAEDVAALLRDESLAGVHIKTDMAGRPRIVQGRCPS